MIRAIAMVWITCWLVACQTGVKGSGTAATETRDISAFTSVSVGGAFDVEYEVSDAPSLTLEGDDNLLAYVTTRVNGGELTIETSERVNPSRDLRVILRAPAVSRFDFAGAVDARLSGFNSDELVIDASGASDIDVRGKVGRLKVDISGAGDLNAMELHGEMVEIAISGAGEAQVYASKLLDVEISGAGNVTYAGNPATVNQSVSGAGRVVATK